MNTKLINYKKSVYLLLFLTFFITSCSEQTPPPPSPKEIVAQQAQARWQALLEGRLETAYEYLAPTYREVNSFAVYRKKMQRINLWKSFELDEVTCEEERCIVKLNAVMQVPAPHPRGEPMETFSSLNEVWVYDATLKKWFYVPKR